MEAPSAILYTAERVPPAFRGGQQRMHKDEAEKIVRRRRWQQRRRVSLFFGTACGEQIEMNTPFGRPQSCRYLHCDGQRIFLKAQHGRRLLEIGGMIFFVFVRCFVRLFCSFLFLFV